jgi:hypothetical protein
VMALVIRSLINSHRPAEYSRAVDGFLWKLNDASGQIMRSTEVFATKEEAEGWMGEHWAELLDEGAETVTLMDADTQLYEMGLRAE